MFQDVTTRGARLPTKLESLGVQLSSVMGDASTNVTGPVLSLHTYLSQSGLCSNIVCCSQLSASLSAVKCSEYKATLLGQSKPHFKKALE